MNLIEKIKAWRNAENPAPITLSNIYAVLQSLKRRNTSDVPWHLEEQIEFRKTVSNPACIATNICLCGCEWKDLIWADKQCDGKCYPLMMDEITWIFFKKKHNIKLNASDHQ